MTGSGWLAAALIAAAATVFVADGGASRLTDLGLPSVKRNPARREPGATAEADVSVRRREPLGRRRRAQRSAIRGAAASVPAALALELRSGRELGAALSAVANEHAHVVELSSRLSVAATAVGAGADPGQVLTASGSAAGAAPRSMPQPSTSSLGMSTAVTAALRPTASCMSAGHRSGLPVADLLDSVAAAAASAAEIEALAAAELAGARASAYLLAALPVAGLGLGQLLGARPGEFLLMSGWGRVCLVLAVALTVAGWLWTRALTRSLLRELTP